MASLPRSASASPSPGLADELREGTRALHLRAERSGIVLELLRGRASRAGYALLLRNLLPAYRSLEEGLERHRDRAGLRGVAQPAVYRAAAVEADLRGLCGATGSRSLPLLPAGARYAERVAGASAGDGSRLLAHAYTRYLGDLNGGRILRRLLADSLGLGEPALRFYRYPQIEDLEAFRRRYRAAFDAAGAFVDREAVVAEARDAFRLNIEVSLEVERAASGLDGGGARGTPLP